MLECGTDKKNHPSLAIRRPFECGNSSPDPSVCVPTHKLNMERDYEGKFKLTTAFKKYNYYFS